MCACAHASSCVYELRLENEVQIDRASLEIYL